MRKLIGAFGLAAAAVVLTACGGGGGSSGNVDLQYRIELRADRTHLPLNLVSVAPGDGVYVGPGMGSFAPYTTTLYAAVWEGGDRLLGESVHCEIVSGLDSGVLLYIDGDDEHEDDDGNPLAYRGIEFENVVGTSFHFHASNQVGTARILCSVNDPRDDRRYSASVDIQVGAATGLPASIDFEAQVPGALLTQDFHDPLSFWRNNIALTAFVMDDSNQRVPNPPAENVRVQVVTPNLVRTDPDLAGFELSYFGLTDQACPVDMNFDTQRSDCAWSGARLLAGPLAGKGVDVRTNSGIAQFSLSSGRYRGRILLKMTADRADNNVSNGIQDSVWQLAAINVLDRDPDAAPPPPLDQPGPVSLNIVAGERFGAALEVTGGTPPYRWEVLDGALGLTVSPFGLVSGALNAAGTYVAIVQVTDAEGQTAQTSVTVHVTEPEPEPEP